ncbi:unnamed protein product, partial [Vitis vinifera]|uniref:Reverse transcriptase domain-containing protein n=1 Tax=Vitis vinifera TaxID=29760 RepID=D7U9J4_VITVI
MSGNVHVRLREKGDGIKTLLYLTPIFNGVCSIFIFFWEYANMILMRCGALHLTFIGLPSLGACVLAFLCNKPLQSETNGCHSALRQIKEEWGTSRRYLEFDIRNCFHTIDRHRLIPIFKEEIDDPKLFYSIHKVFSVGRLVEGEKGP